MSQSFDGAQLHLFDLKGRQVLVLGLGDSGVAMARWSARRGARVRVADTRSVDGTDLPQLQALREQAGAIAGAIEYAAGPAWSERWLDGVDLVAWSPGLSIERGESARFHALARERGIAVAGELELFAQALADLRESGYRPKVIAVTGTNGKTTTVALAGHLCRGAGLETIAAGNIRPAMLDALGAAIDADALPQAWVLELSSFQLALAQGFAPDAAAILNVSEDHLDWHASMDSYVAAKQRIYGPSTVAVFDRSDGATVPRRAAATPAVRNADAAARRAEAQRPARRAGDARADAGESRTGAPLPITFGVDAPQAAGYAQAVEVSAATRILHVSGQIPAAMDGSVPEGFEDQCRLAWRNVIAQLSAAGMTLDNLVKLTIFLSDRKHIADYRRVRQEVLQGRQVALTTIITGIFDEAWLLEIEAVAAA